MIVILMVLSGMRIFSFTGIKNPDTPLKGEWDFKPVKIWTIDRAGDRFLARPGQIAAAPDGTVYLHDTKHKVNFIFSPEGKFIKAFGEKGEGPSEIRNQWKMDIVNNRLMISDADRIHYFTLDGTYVKSVIKSNLSRTRNLFIDENQMVSAPLFKVDNPDGIGKIIRYQLKTREQVVLVRFPMPTPYFVRLGGREIVISVPSLTPDMILGYDDGRDPGKQRILYGINNEYIIHSVDLNGKSLDSFALNRGKRKISTLEKRKHMQGDRSQLDEMGRQVAKVTPNQLTYFNKIEVHNGLIYVFESSMENTPKSQKVDIFSREGKYLYCSHIALQGNVKMYRPSTLVIQDNYLYLRLQGEEGEMMIGKYRVNLPTLSP
jgi:hypothetical protein